MDATTIYVFKMIGKILFLLAVVIAFVIYWGMSTIPMSETLGAGNVYSASPGLYVPSFYQLLIYYGIPLPSLAFLIGGIFFRRLRFRFLYISAVLFFDWYYLMEVLPDAVLLKATHTLRHVATVNSVVTFKPDDFIVFASANLFLIAIYIIVFAGVFGNLQLRRPLAEKQPTK